MEVVDNRKTTIKSKLSDSKIVKRIRSNKNFQIIIAIFIFAIGLIIYSSIMTAKDVEKKQTTMTQTMNDEEQRLATILSGIGGAGNVETLITKTDGEIVGVLIVAEGADNISVRLRLLDATSTALGVNKKIINVYQMK